MTTDLALADDGLTVEFDSYDDCADLTTDEAEAVTGRIRRWVNDFPIEDVVLAFRGRIWIALTYDSWAEWCECELGGLKLPAPKRREVVAGLTDAGISGEAIAAALDVSNATVSRDRTLTNVRVDPDRKTLGQDGRERSQPQPKPEAPQPDVVIDAEIVCRDCDGYGCETCYPADVPATEEQMSAMADLSDDQFEAAVAAARDDGDLSARNVVEHGQQSSNPAAPQRKTPDKPITKSFDSAVYDLKGVVKRVVNLSEHDRFKKNKDQISGCHLSDLVRARDAINGVIQQLEG